MTRRMNQGGALAVHGGAEDGMEDKEELEGASVATSWPDVSLIFLRIGTPLLGAAGEYDGGVAAEDAKADDMSDAGADDEEDEVVKKSDRAEANSVEDLLMD